MGLLGQVDHGVTIFRDSRLRCPLATALDEPAQGLTGDKAK